MVMSPPNSSHDPNGFKDQVSRQQEEADKKRHEALSKEYGEVCNTFRTLTDIRFKLLAFLPIAAAAAVAALTGSAAQQRPTAVMLALSLFGLVVTIALVTYNARNDQLYDDLVARAADIERSLNIPDGAFANRARPWLQIPLLLFKWRIDHRTAVSTIYGASIALWLFGVLRSGLYAFYGKNAPWWTNLLAIAIAIVLSILGSLWVKENRKKAREHIQTCAREAMHEAVELRESRAADGDIVAFVKACVGEGNDSFIKVCSDLSGDTKDELRERARFYSRLATKNDRERLSHYLPQGPGDLEASHFIGLLTDLPPQTIYDAYHNRKGEMPEEQLAQPGDRAGSQETPVDVSEMSDEDLMRIIGEAANELESRKKE